MNLLQVLNAIGHQKQMSLSDVGQGGKQEIPTRAEIEDVFKWNLEDIYCSEEEWNADATELLSLLAQFTKLSGHLAEQSETFLQVLQLQDKIGEISGKLFVYARMHRDEDNRDAKYQALADKAMGLLVQVQSATAFLVPEILEIPPARIDAFFQEQSELQIYRFEIDEILRQKPHILSKEAEQLLASVGELTSAPQQIFTMFNHADIKFPDIEDEQGNILQVTHGKYAELLENPHREVRKRAYESVHSTYANHVNTLGATYGASVKNDVFYAKVRNYPSALEAALEPDRIPVSVYDNLIETIRSSLPIFHKYLRLRKRVLGLDNLTMYDLNVPLVPDLNVKIPYPEAVQTVQKAMNVLGTEYVQVATEGLASGWVDVYETKGKSSGGYSWGAYGTHPYILLNYQDNLDDMFTLAHELGHAMHRYFSSLHQPYVYHSYTIFVAEVASTCNEALLVAHLLQHTEDTNQRAYLLNHHLETIRGTVIQQTLFAEFEKKTHAHIEEGEALTAEWLSETYLQLLQTYYGEVCVIPEEARFGWARIPHFYNAFYVYKYATGLSAATALAKRILHGGQNAVNDYLQLLKSGCSQPSIDLLRHAGVDMQSPQPIKDTLQLFSSLVDQLSELLA